MCRGGGTRLSAPPVEEVTRAEEARLVALVSGASRGQGYERAVQRAKASTQERTSDVQLQYARPGWPNESGEGGGFCDAHRLPEQRGGRRSGYAGFSQHHRILDYAITESHHRHPQYWVPRFFGKGQ